MFTRNPVCVKYVTIFCGGTRYCIDICVDIFSGTRVEQDIFVLGFQARYVSKIG